MNELSIMIMVTITLISWFDDDDDDDEVILKQDIYGCLLCVKDICAIHIVINIYI
jgi:hypothetical protein